MNNPVALIAAIIALLMGIKALPIVVPVTVELVTWPFTEIAAAYPVVGLTIIIILVVGPIWVLASTKR